MWSVCMWNECVCGMSVYGSERACGVCVCGMSVYVECGYVE